MLVTILYKWYKYLFIDTHTLVQTEYILFFSKNFQEVEKRNLKKYTKASLYYSLKGPTKWCSFVHKKREREKIYNGIPESHLPNWEKTSDSL